MALCDRCNGEGKVNEVSALSASGLVRVTCYVCGGDGHVLPQNKPGGADWREGLGNDQWTDKQLDLFAVGVFVVVASIFALRFGAHSLDLGPSIFKLPLWYVLPVIGGIGFVGLRFRAIIVGLVGFGFVIFMILMVILFFASMLS